MTKKRGATKKSGGRRPSASASKRSAAKGAASPSTAGDKELTALMELLGDGAAPIKARRAALQSLGAARFSSPTFPSMHGDYVAVLRKLAEDPDHELRQRVLGILAREQDGYAQRRLLEGLKQPEKALLPPEKALQLLGYDVHADAYPIAREIVRNPPNAMARREALRLLAGDAASAPMFEAVLRDKKETAEVRQLGASALHALKPGSLQAHAREILLDANEHDDMHEMSLTALTQFGAADTADDKTLSDRVDQLMAAGSKQLQDCARKFKTKYRR